MSDLGLEGTRSGGGDSNSLHQSGASELASHASGNTDAEHTVSATSMPRSAGKRSVSVQEDQSSEEGSASSELGAEQQNEDSDVEDERSGSASNERNDPSSAVSLTIAALSPWSSLTLQRRLSLIGSAILTHVGLPFLNGVMIGFGEIFGRVVLAPALGITGVSWNGNTDRARVRNIFSRRQTPTLNSTTGGGRPTQSSWGAWGQGSSGTVDEFEVEKREERGEEMYL